MSSFFPFVSVIILNYNGKNYLQDCLSSVLTVDYPSQKFEIIFVDNASKDGSVAYVKKNFPFVRVLALEKNLGFTGGNNKGVELSVGEILVFLNNDTVVDKAWLRQLVCVFNNNAIAISGSRIFYMSQPDVAQYAGGYLHLIGGAIFCPFHGDEPDKSFYYVSSVCGASFAMRKSVFNYLGGFDEDFFMYAEEGDLCLRTLVSGYKIVYSPFSIIYHSAGGSGPKRKQSNKLPADTAQARLLSALTIYYGNRNSIALAMKSLEIKNVFRALIFSYAYLFYQLIALLRSGRVEAKLLVKASFWPVLNFKHLLKKRVKIQSQRKISDSALIQKGLVLSIGQTLKLRAQLKKD